MINMETNVRVTEGGFTHALWSLPFLRVRVGPQVRFGKGGGIVWRLTKACHSDWMTAMFLKEAKGIHHITSASYTDLCTGRLKFRRWIWHSGLESHLSPVSFTTLLISLQLLSSQKCCDLYIVWLLNDLSYCKAHNNFLVNEDSVKGPGIPKSVSYGPFFVWSLQKLLLMCLVVQVVSVDGMRVTKCKPSRK